MASPELSESVSRFLQSEREAIVRAKLELAQYHERCCDISGAGLDLKYFLVSSSGAKDVVAFPAQEDKTTRLNALETIRLRQQDLYRVEIIELLGDTSSVAITEVLCYEEDREVLTKAVEVAIANMNDLRKEYGSGKLWAAPASRMHGRMIREFRVYRNTIRDNLKESGGLLLEKVEVIMNEPILS